MNWYKKTHITHKGAEQLFCSMGYTIHNVQAEAKSLPARFSFRYFHTPHNIDIDIYIFIYVYLYMHVCVCECMCVVCVDIISSDTIHRVYHR